MRTLLNIEAVYVGEKFIRVNIDGLVLAMVKRILNVAIKHRDATVTEIAF